MIERVLVAGAVIFASWVVGLVTIEYAALALGITGSVTGSFALWKAISALRGLSELEEETKGSLTEMSQEADAVQSKLTDD